MTRHSAVEVLVAGRMLPLIEDNVAQHFQARQVGVDGDLDAIARAHGAAIRGIAGGPHHPIDASLMDRLPALEIIANFGVGYDMVDVTAAKARGVMVTNTPDVLTEEVADTAIGLLLMTVRQLSWSERYLRAGEWVKAPFPLTPATLRGRHVGILGLGRIGKAIARRLEAFDIAVSYYGRRQQKGVAYPYHSTLSAMAEAVDTLIIVAPGGADTHHLVDSSVLQALGSNGIVINVGRGSVVDETALVDALQAGRILSAGLDVFEHEPTVPQALIDMDNVVLLPHVGSASQHTRDAMGQLVIDNLRSWFDQGKPLTPVPEMDV